MIILLMSDDNVLLQEFTTRASGYVEDAGVIESESESDITKRLLLKNPKMIQFHYCDLRIHSD